MSDITVLAFPTIAYPIQDTDILYVLRGTGNDRDTKAEASSFLRQTINVSAIPATVDLSTATGDATIFVAVAGGGVLTLSNSLVSNKELKIVNIGTSSFSVAGSWVEPSVIVGDVLTLFSNGTTLYKDFSIVTDGTRLRKRVLQIGDWDMSTATGDDFVNVAHTLSSNMIIKEISVMIRDDTNTKNSPLSIVSPGTGVLHGGVSTTSSVIIQIGRLTGGIFDSVEYDSTSFNRGWITVTYEV